jgi:hypothetical protein
LLELAVFFPSRNSAHADKGIHANALARMNWSGMENWVDEGVELFALGREIGSRGFEQGGGCQAGFGGAGC